MNWYQLSVAEVLEQQKTSAKGLTIEDCQQRIEKFGPNELVEKKRISPIVIFFNQFKDFMIIILIIAAIISGALGDLVDTIVIILIVIINAIIGDTSTNNTALMKSSSWMLIQYFCIRLDRKSVV